jgi:glutamyl-tRNA synthetase
MSDDRFHELAVHALARAGIDTNLFPLEYVKAALDTCKGKVKIFGELPAYAGFYFKPEVVYDEPAAQKEFTPENKPRLERLRQAFAALEPFDHDSAGAALAATAKELGVKNGVLVHPTRLACTGNTSGPSLYHLLAIFGKEKVLQRLDQALRRF